MVGQLRSVAHQRRPGDDPAFRSERQPDNEQEPDNQRPQRQSAHGRRNGVTERDAADADTIVLIHKRIDCNGKQSPILKGLKA